MLPDPVLNNSTKFSSSVSVASFLINVNAVLNLWAPGAFTFDEPAALSFNELSSDGVTKLSVTLKPTLYVGVFEYGSSIKVCSVFATKKPLIKY